MNNLTKKQTEQPIIWLEPEGDDLTLEVYTRGYHVEKNERGRIDRCILTPALIFMKYPFIADKHIVSLGFRVKNSSDNEINSRLDEELTELLFVEFLQNELKDKALKLSEKDREFFDIKFRPICLDTKSAHVSQYNLRNALIYCEKHLNPEFAKFEQSIARTKRQIETEDKENGKN